MAKKVKTEGGRISIPASTPKANKGSEIRDLINKKGGNVLAFNLEEDNPTEVIEWIPTGSRWLDSIICKGKMAGIPVGKIVEIAGLSGTGKSYLASHIGANAQKAGHTVVYFDSESAIDPQFMQALGIDLSNLIYVQATTVEFVLEKIDEILAQNFGKVFFIWDSLAFTPSEADKEADFDPQSTMAKIPRILTLGFKKLLLPLANSQSTLLVLNQLKTNINTKNPADMLVNPYFTPGGLAPSYAYSLRIWLTGRKSKDSFVYNDNGYAVGSEVKVRIEKSRFGTLRRVCTFKILWGTNDVAIQDEESWLTAVKSSSKLELNGSWYTLTAEDGTTYKFQSKEWLNKLKDDKFKLEVQKIMDEELIMKFDKMEGNAKNHYSLDDEEDELPDIVKVEEED